MIDGFYCTACGAYANDDVLDKGVCPKCGNTSFREMTIEDTDDYERESDEDDYYDEDDKL